MHDETRQLMDELIDLIEDSELPVEITALNIQEYWVGDPSSNESEPTGGEIELNCAYQLDAEHDDDDNPFRVK